VIRPPTRHKLTLRSIRRIDLYGQDLQAKADAVGCGRYDSAPSVRPSNTITRGSDRRGHHGQCCAELVAQEVVYARDVRRSDKLVGLPSDMSGGKMEAVQQCRHQQRKYRHSDEEFDQREAALRSHRD